MRKLITIMLIILTICILSPAYISANPEPVMPDRYTLYRVQPNDSLWAISGRFMPNIDNRRGVYWIKQCNGIPDGYVIQPGDQLNIPDDDGEMAEPWGQD